MIGHLSKKNNIFEEIQIMVLDDDKFARSLIKTALSQIGARNTIEAANAIEALECLKGMKVDIILADQEMPGITGLEFTRLVRRGPDVQENKNIPIIVVSGNTDEETIKEAKLSGIQEYIAKPISPALLERKLKKVLGVGV